MDSSEIRHRNVENKQNTDNKKLDIIDGPNRSIYVEIYNREDNIYKTVNIGFLVETFDDKEYNDYCFVGRLVNGQIVPITDGEREIFESNGYIVGETYKPKSFLERWGFY